MGALVLVRMRGDDGGAGPGSVEHGAHDAAVDADVLLQPDRHRVRGAVRIAVVVGELEAGKEEQVVQRLGAGRLAFQLGPVCGVVLERDADVARVACTEPGVVGANDVIRDAEDVESTGADEVDELAHGEGTVAPRRVGVQLGEKWRTRVPHARIVLATGWVVG